MPWGTTDVTWQAVGGVKRVCRAPERAWAFWQATVCKNPSLAPSDLQSKARQWISMGGAGY